MDSSLDAKQVNELLEQCRSLAAQEKVRGDKLVPRNEELLQEICASLTVPTSAFGMSYARAYYGKTASIFGIPIDAGLGLILHGLAACFGFTLDKGAQRVGKFVHDIANGAFASWASALGAELGLKKRMEEPAPAPQLNTGANEMPKRAPRPMSHEELAALKTAMPQRPTTPMTREELAAFSVWTAMNTSSAMLERPAAPPTVHAPPPMPPPTSIRNNEVAAERTPTPSPTPQSITPQHSPLNTQPLIVATAKIEATAASPPAPQKQYRFTKRWTVDPEAEMRRLLQSHGAPSDPQTVASVLYHENPMDAYRTLVKRARAPA